MGKGGMAKPTPVSRSLISQKDSRSSRGNNPGGTRHKAAGSRCEQHSPADLFFPCAPAAER